LCNTPVDAAAINTAALAIALFITIKF
jgi:hypothetical protein